MINLNDLINLDRLRDFYNKLIEYLTGKYYDKSEVNNLIPDTSDLISNDDLGELIIDLYDSTKADYAVDDYVIYQKRLYRCKTANTTNLPTNTTDWEKVNVIDTIDKKIQDNTPDLTSYVTEENLGDVIADLYNDSTVYHLNDYVIQDKTLYRCKVAATTAGPWDEDHWSDSWQKINIARIFSTTAPGLVPAPTAQDVTDKNLLAADGTFVPHQDLSEYIKELNLGDIIAEVFSTSKTYAVGDYVIHDKKLYRCTTAVQTAGDWSGSNWTQVKSTDIFSGSAPGLVPAATPQDADKTLMGDGSWGRPMSATASYNSTTQEFHLDFSNGG